MLTFYYAFSSRFVTKHWLKIWPYFQCVATWCIVIHNSNFILSLVFGHQYLIRLYSIATRSRCGGIFNDAFTTQDKLQNDIHRLNDWANEWQLKLNVDNCCGMTYTASISNLCHTKYYTDNGTMRYELLQILLMIWEWDLTQNCPLWIT